MSKPYRWEGTARSDSTPENAYASPRAMRSSMEQNWLLDSRQVPGRSGQWEDPEDEKAGMEGSSRQAQAEIPGVQAHLRP